jgi:hypothetical protein
MNSLIWVQLPNIHFLLEKLKMQTLSKPSIMKPGSQTKISCFPKNVLRPIAQAQREHAENIRKARELPSAPNSGQTTCG